MSLRQPGVGESRWETLSRPPSLAPAGQGAAGRGAGCRGERGAVVFLLCCFAGGGRAGLEQNLREGLASLERTCLSPGGAETARLVAPVSRRCSPQPALAGEGSKGWQQIPNLESPAAKHARPSPTGARGLFGSGSCPR